MTAKVYCPDIECESCVRLLKKSFENVKGLGNYSFNKDSIDFQYDQAFISPEDLIKIINERGFRASLTPYPRKTFKERFRDFRENKTKYENEYKIIKYSILAFVLISILEIIAYYGLFKNYPDFISKYLIWIFYVNVSVLTIGTSIWHIKSYKTELTSMVGMMVGMTFGMQTGMMLGTIIGATNGFFMGATIGMLLGVLVGFYNGKCCGIMGILEGLMAGLMGGVMGGMTGAMFIADKIQIFMPIFMLINLIIMIGLSYMLFEESIEHNPKVQKNKIDFFSYFSYCLVFILIIVAMIIYGPKSGLAGVLA